MLANAMLVSLHFLATKQLPKLQTHALVPAVVCALASKPVCPKAY